jgi:hypothetical protein
MQVESEDPLEIHPRSLRQAYAGAFAFARAWCTAPKCRDWPDLQVHGIAYAARWYSFITPQRTFRRRTGASSGMTTDFVMAGRPLLPRLMRPMSVIVPGAGPQHRPQMGFAADQHPVSALRPHRWYPASAMTARPGRPRRSLHDPHALAGEDGTERGGELWGRGPG